jgi:hypothetical protein
MRAFRLVRFEFARAGAIGSHATSQAASLKS